MKIKPFVYGILVVGVFLGVIYGFRAVGVWSVSGKIDGQGKAIQPSAADVNTIKGWMTLEQVSTAFGIPVADIHLAVVNGQLVELDEVIIAPQDEVKIFPPVGGG